MRKNIVLGLLALAILYPGAGMGQGWNVEMTSSLYNYWAAAEDIAVEDSIVFLACGEAGLRIYNFSDMENIFLAGVYKDIDNVKGIKVDDNYAFLAAGSDGLEILDISDISNPQPIANMNFPGSVTDIEIEQELAYIADGTLHIVDISNPLEPIEIGVWDDGFRVNDVKIQGNYVYAAVDSGWSFFSAGYILAIDVSNPAAPVMTGWGGYCESAYKTTVYNRMGFLASNFGLQVFNISNPFGEFPLIWYNMWCFIGDIETADNLFLMSDAGMLRTFNLTGDTLVEADSIVIPFLGNIGIEQESAYLASSNTIIKVIDFSNPLELNVVTEYGCQGVTENVVIQGNYAYLACVNDGMKIIDISVPEMPIEIGHFESVEEILNLIVEGNYAYTTGGYDGVKIVDISNPANPIELGYYSGGGMAKSAAKAGEYLYIAYGNNGVSVFDISNPNNFVQIACFDTANGANDIKIQGSLACTISGGSLSITDISDPFVPINISITSTGGYSINGLYVIGDYAYLSGQTGLIMNITDPYQPYISGTIPTGHYSYDVFADSCHCYFTEWDFGIEIFYIADSCVSFKIGDYPTPGKAFGLTVRGNYLYLADYYYFEIFDCSQALSVENPPAVNAPYSFNLLSCYPNPFNNSTTITFDLPAAGEIELKVYDISGREAASLVTGHWSLGEHSVVWDAEGCASGVYFIKLSAVSCQLSAKNGGQSSVKKVVLLK